MSGAGDARGTTTRADVVSSDREVLRNLAVTAAVSCAILFVIVGLQYQLQLYGDGSIFSYSVAVEDAWAFHWHNISGRVFVYFASLFPAELYVSLTDDAAGGIVVYGFLFFVAQICGLAATCIADGSRGRIIFVYACASTAILCPLVFGFPTEVWMTHALFWPLLASCHYGRPGLRGFVVILALMTALVFTHLSGMIFALAILTTLLMRGPKDPAFLRAAAAWVLALSVWSVVRAEIPPDDYFGPVLARAAWAVFDINICTGRLVRLFAAALAGYGIAFLVFRRMSLARAHFHAACFAAAGLIGYWILFDHGLHTQNRYYLRTALLVMAPAFGILGAAFALSADGNLRRPLPLLPGVMRWLSHPDAVRAAIGALALVLFVHAVETAKFAVAWSHYKDAVRSLALGTASDVSLGNPRFVSSARIGADLNRLSWFSTTPYLSILVAPKFAPARLVVDPTSNYFWLSCETATENLEADREIPVESRKLIRAYSCLHRD